MNSSLPYLLSTNDTYSFMSLGEPKALPRTFYPDAPFPPPGGPHGGGFSSLWDLYPLIHKRIEIMKMRSLASEIFNKFTQALQVMMQPKLNFDFLNDFFKASDRQFVLEASRPNRTLFQNFWVFPAEAADKRYPEHEQLREATTEEEALKIDFSKLEKINTMDSEGYTLLDIAASEGYTQLMEVFLKKGADPSKGYGALASAFDHNQKDAFKFLLDSGANPDVMYNVAFSEELPLLHHMIEDSERLKDDMIEMLLDHKASVNLQDSDHEIPLHVAARFGSLKTFKRLIKLNSSLTHRCSQGNTALHELFIFCKEQPKRQMEKALFLIERFPSLLFMKNSEDQTPVDFFFLSLRSRQNRESREITPFEFFETIYIAMLKSIVGDRYRSSLGNTLVHELTQTPSLLYNHKVQSELKHHPELLCVQNLEGHKAHQKALHEGNWIVAKELVRLGKSLGLTYHVDDLAVAIEANMPIHRLVELVQTSAYDVTQKTSQGEYIFDKALKLRITNSRKFHQLNEDKSQLLLELFVRKAPSKLGNLLEQIKKMMKVGVCSSHILIALEQGKFNLDAKDSIGQTFLDTALMARRKDLVIELLRMGATKYSLRDDKNTLMHHAVSELLPSEWALEDLPEIIERFRGEFHLKNRWGLTPFEQACVSGKWWTAKVLYQVKHKREISDHDWINVLFKQFHKLGDLAAQFAVFFNRNSELIDKPDSKGNVAIKLVVDAKRWALLGQFLALNPSASSYIVQGELSALELFFHNASFDEIGDYLDELYSTLSRHSEIALPSLFNDLEQLGLCLIRNEKLDEDEKKLVMRYVMTCSELRKPLEQSL